MKKVLLFVCLFYAAVSSAETTVSPKSVSVKEMLREDPFEQELSAYDMKIFHDRKLMQTIVQELHSYGTNSQGMRGDRFVFSQAVFSEKDSNILEKAKDGKQIQYDLTDENLNALLQESYDYPFTTFKNLIMNAKITLPSYSEISEINQVDKKAISNFIQTVSEAGPAIGSAPVSISYEHETQDSN